MFAPDSFDWHSAATVVTLYIALFIQRATHRDTQALHAKVDELIRVNSKARDGIAAVDDQEPEDIEEHRKRKQP